jgi:hypothetical protein
MSEWDKLVSELENVQEGSVTLSADGWLGENDGRQDHSLRERMLRVEVELLEIGRAVDDLREMIGSLDASAVVVRLDETNERLRTIRNAIAIQGPTFGYLFLAVGGVIGVLATLKYWF